MMPEINGFHSYFQMLILVLLLGMRHGIDLDHLAVIDSITRRLPIDNKLSRLVGFFFSLGHGLVVIFFCLIFNFFVKDVLVPNFLVQLMSALSILFLITFGAINIYTLIKSKPSHSHTSFLSTKLFSIFNKLNIDKPTKVMIVGAVFAVSFDTISQAALFSIYTTNFFSLLFSILLATMFMLGMIITDGLNGYLISMLIGKTSNFSLYLSRLFTLLIGIFSMTIGIYELTQFL